MESNLKAVVVDANVWIALLDKQDSLYDKAYTILKSFDAKTQVLLTDYVIQEVMTVLLYKNRQRVINTFLRYIEDEPRFITIGIDPEFFSSVTKFIADRKYSPKISLTDWSLLFLQTYFAVNLVTFDKQLAHASRRIAAEL